MMIIFKSKSWKALSCFCLVLVLMFMLSGDALAYTVKARWINRAKIQVEEIKFNNDDSGSVGFSLSDPSDSVVKTSGGNPKLAEIVNEENKGIYEVDDIVSQNFEYKKGVCDNGSAVIDLGGGNIDQSKGDVVTETLKWNYSVTGSATINGCNNFAQKPIRELSPLHKAGIQIEDPNGLKDVWFIADDDLKIVRKVDNNDGKFEARPGENENIYYAEFGASCDDNFGRLIIDEGSKSQPLMTGTYHSCVGGEDRVVKIIKQSEADKLTPGTTDTTDTVAPTCESTNGVIIISWLLCQVVDLMDSAVNGSIELIDSLLVVNGEDFSNDKDLYAVWSLFRAISSFALVAVVMVMIIGQAMGGDS